MWYVIHVLGGQEHIVKLWIDKTMLAEQCFIPLRERRQKYNGTWNVVQEMIFPGYLFVVTKKPEQLLENLRKIPRFTRMLGASEEGFIALSEQEIRFISRFGDENHISRPSLVKIEEGNRVRIISGNLLDYEGEIVRYNLHKRTATVRVQFMGRDVDVYLGIEIVEKIEEKNNFLEELK